MREQAQKQFGAVKTAADELLATLDATQKAKADRHPAGPRLRPRSNARRVRGRSAAQALTRSIGASVIRTLTLWALERPERVAAHSCSDEPSRRISAMSMTTVAHAAPSAPALRLGCGRLGRRRPTAVGARRAISGASAADPEP